MTSHPRTPWVAVALFVAGLILALTFTFLAFRQQHETAEQICQSAVENRDAVRLTWDSARDLILAGVTDPQRIDATNDFFNGVLKQVPALRCEGSTPIEVGGSE